MSIAFGPIRSADDAVAAVRRLHELYGLAHAAVLLDDGCHPLEVFVGLESIDDTLGSASFAVLEDPRVAYVVLLSAVKSITEGRAVDAATFRHTRDVFAMGGVDVIDWMQTDGTAVTSVALGSGLPPGWTALEP